jgi:CheY-like chemotaxis protein
MDRLPNDSTAPHDVSLEVLRRLSAMTDLAGRLRAGGSAGEVEACARTLAHDAEDVRRLVEQARDLQRAEQGGLMLHPVVCRLREVMGMVEDDWKERMAAAGLEFRVSYEGEREQAAVIDTGRVRQLFDTLLGRALTETTTGAVTASLRVRPDANRLMLEACVEDSGRLLSPGELAHIFDPAETGRSDALASLPTRIGMALANRLVAAMAGVLQAQDRENGGVAITFTVMVPAAELDIPRSPHVLIVEDNAINRLVAEALCEMFDCTSEQARDGVEALEAVNTRAFDLILMDIKMPRMDGVTATRQIRAMAGAAGRTPIVALTANAERADVSRYLEAGMNEVVEKPIKPAELASVLEMLPVWMEGGKTAAA